MSTHKVFLVFAWCLSAVTAFEVATSHASMVSGDGYRYGYGIVHGPPGIGHSVGESFPHGYGGYGAAYAPSFGYGPYAPPPPPPPAIHPVQIVQPLVGYNPYDQYIPLDPYKLAGFGPYK